MADKRKIIDLQVNTGDSDKKLQGVKKGFDDVNKSANQSSEAVGKMGSQLDSVTGGAVGKLKGFKDGIAGVVGGFKSLSIAIAATGIGALVLGIIGLVQAFKRSEEGQNKFAKIMGVIGAVTGQFLDLLAALGDKIIWVFENPKKAMENFVKLIKDQIVNRFVGLLELIPKVGEAISLVFSGEFSKAGQVAADALGKVVLGVENVTAKIGEASNALGKFINQTIKEAETAAKIADQRAKADKLTRDLLVQRANADRERAELLEKAVNKEKYALEERIGFLQAASELEQDITNKEIQAAQLRLQAKQAENALGLSTKADLDEEAQLKADLINLEAARLRKQKEVTGQIVALKTEQSAAEKAIRDAEQAAIDEENKIKNEKELQRQKDLKTLLDEFQKTVEDEAAEKESEKLELEQQRKLEELERLKATEEQKANIRLFYEGKISKALEKETALQKKNDFEVLRAKESMAKNTFSNIATALDENSKAGKAAAAAAALINTYQGITAELSTKTVTPFEFAIKLANVATTAFIGFKAVKNILKTNSKSTSAAGGGGEAASGTGGTPSQPQTPRTPEFNVVGATQTSQLADTIASQQSQPIRTYVVASEVSTMQAMDRQRRQSATIGG